MAGHTQGSHKIREMKKKKSSNIETRNLTKIVQQIPADSVRQADGLQKNRIKYTNVDS